MLESVRALLENVIDYAGLFPPAELSMPRAAANYGRYLAGADGWMLGRLMVPAGRLQELENYLASNRAERKWRISALTGADLLGAVSAVLAFNAHAAGAEVDSLETKPGSADAIPDGFTTYFEVPSGCDPAPVLQAIAAVKGRAKMRTGGITQTMFPGIEELVRFIRRCDDAKTPYKLTAGLHHATPGVHPLTYDTGAPTGRMHGFLNVLLAGALLWSGIPDQEMQTMLGEQAPQFSFTRKGIGWRDRWISTEQIRNARKRLVISFGSCSFEEPVNELRAMGLL